MVRHLVLVNKVTVDGWLCAVPSTSCWSQSLALTLSSTVAPLDSLAGCDNYLALQEIANALSSFWLVLVKPTIPLPLKLGSSTCHQVWSLVASALSQVCHICLICSFSLLTLALIGWFLNLETGRARKTALQVKDSSSLEPPKELGMCNSSTPVETESRTSRTVWKLLG